MNVSKEEQASIAKELALNESKHVIALMLRPMATSAANAYFKQDAEQFVMMSTCLNYTVTTLLEDHDAEVVEAIGEKLTAQFRIIAEEVRKDVKIAEEKEQKALEFFKRISAILDRLNEKVDENQAEK